MTNFRNAMMAAAQTASDTGVSIGKSALYVSGNSEYLTWSSSSAGNRKTWTYSWWFQRGKVGTDYVMLGAGPDSNQHFYAYFDSSERMTVYLKDGSGTTKFLYQTNRTFEDIVWYHCVLAVDTTPSTPTVKLYTNGVQETSFNTSTMNMAQDYEGWFNNGSSGAPFTVGRLSYASSYHWDGYIAEVVFIDGSALAPTSFGELSDDGYWTPLSSSTIKALTFGTNGFYLDNATNAQTDASGEGNNFTNTNTVTLATHTPTHLEPLFNPISLPNKLGTLAYSAGNTVFTYTGNGTNMLRMAPQLTLPVPANTGKWYMEAKWSDIASSYGGLIAVNTQKTDWGGGSSSWDMQPSYDAAGSTTTESAGIQAAQDLNIYIRGSSTTSDTGVNWDDDNDRMVICIDTDNRKLYCGIWDNSGSTTVWYAADGGNDGNPNTGSNESYEFPAGTLAYHIHVGLTSNAQSTAKSVTLYTKEGDWAGTQPTGAKEINSTNLTAPSVSDLGDYFATTLYTGNGSTQTITTNVDADLVFIKNRSATDSWCVFDTLRGVQKVLHFDTTAAEATDADTLTAFNSTGFALGDDDKVSTNTENFVSFSLKAGGAPTATNSEAQGDPPTSGSYMIDGSASSADTIGTADITKLSVNTKLGFSIGTYNGSNSDTTLQTGLTDCKMIIIKRTNDTYNWAVWHKDLTDDYSMFLNTNAAQANNSYFDTSENTSTLFHLEGNSNATSIAGGTFVFYAFSESSFISISKYTGNNASDGPYVPYISGDGLPLQMEFTLNKRIDSATGGYWTVIDAVREPTNAGDMDPLWTTDNWAEGSSGYTQDYVTGGMKLRMTDANFNAASPYAFLTIGHPIISKDGLVRQGR